MAEVRKRIPEDAMAIEQSLIDADYCYITTIGRVTGKPHTVEIWFALAGAALYVLAGGGEGADFVRNARKAPSVAVRIQTTQFRGNTRSVADDAEDARAREMLLQKYTARGNSDLEGWVRDALPLAFDLTPANP